MITKRTDQLNTGDFLSVRVTSAWVNGGTSNRLAIASFGGDVEAVTLKAVKLAAETKSGKKITVWLPRRALLELCEVDHDNNPQLRPAGNQRFVMSALANWFKPDDWTQNFIRMTTQVQ